MKKLAASLALIALFTTQGFADQLRWIDNEPDAQDAGARIQEGMPFVNWVSHDDGNSPRLMVVSSCRVQVVPGEGRWEVLVHATPVAERQGKKWVALKDAKKELAALDLANVYIPTRRLKAGQEFKNIAHTLALQTTIREQSLIVVPSGPMNAAIKASDTVMQAKASRGLMASDMRDDEQVSPDMRDDEQLPPQRSPDMRDDEQLGAHGSAHAEGLCAACPDTLKIRDREQIEANLATVEAALTPEEEDAFWDEVGNQAMDASADTLSQLIQLWIDGSEDGEDVAQGKSVQRNTAGALGAIEEAMDEQTAAHEIDTSAQYKIDTSAQGKLVESATKTLRPFDAPLGLD
jgi:hypothetical protein